MTLDVHGIDGIASDPINCRRDIVQRPLMIW
jgi:hypothetical protein